MLPRLATEPRGVSAVGTLRKRTCIPLRMRYASAADLRQACTGVRLRSGVSYMW
ncbi:hypothetical protein J2T17_001591 [Paenibacillus mucilaginosus]|uniref:hypothetical protein n=1 Tax=Paenibacillus mucilaginosus TaxID=61624 RepID=UPI003D21DB39